MGSAVQSSKQEIEMQASSSLSKPIAIKADNKAAIEQALEAINGRSSQHAYTEYYEISELAEEAEKLAVGLLGAKTHAVGAAWTETSGQVVNNTYARTGFSRAATRVTLQRKTGGWYLTGVSRQDVGQRGGGSGRLTLTPAQADRALMLCRAQFDIAE